MTCPNQLELGEKIREKKLTDESTKEGPHSVGVWTLKIQVNTIYIVSFLKDGKDLVLVLQELRKAASSGSKSMLICVQFLISFQMTH